MARRGRTPETEIELDAALAGLADAVDAIAVAVGSHDLAALEAANARALTLQGVLAARIAAIDEAERVRPAHQIAVLVGRLRFGVRRNALLIERAWAIDAATTRLLMSLGRHPNEPRTGVYVPEPIVTIERRA